MEVLIPMAGFIDKDKKVERLTKSVEKLEKIERMNNKLGNPGFTDKAPPAVIEKRKLLGLLVISLS